MANVVVGNVVRNIRDEDKQEAMKTTLRCAITSDGVRLNNLMANGCL